MGVAIGVASPLQGVSLLDPASPDRFFPLLSWQGRLVGRVTFSPSRMQVLDATSGAVESYRPTEKGWAATDEATDPLPLAHRLGDDLDCLLDGWPPARRASSRVEAP